MIKVVGGAVTGFLLINVFLYLMGALLVFGGLGAPVYYLDRMLGIYAFSDDASTLPVEAISVQWSGETGKSMTLRVTNASGEPMSRFMISCSSDGGWVDITDMSGIIPGETSVRTYAIPEVSNPTTINTVWGCEITKHFRGKPSQYNEASVAQYGDEVFWSGWGDRIRSVDDQPVSMEGDDIYD